MQLASEKENKAILITDDSASEYYVENLNYQTNVNVHLSNFTMEKLMEVPHDSILKWQRKDERVTQDILRMKSTTTALNIESGSPGTATMNRLTIDLKYVMGCRLSATSLTLDVCKPPLFQVKDGKCWTTTHLPTCSTDDHSSFAFRVHVVAKPFPSGAPKKTSHNFLYLAGHPCLKEPIKRGLCEKYQHEVEKLHESFPVIRDPTLVRAAQVAVLSFLDGTTNVESTINLYRGLFASFSSLLSKRQTRLNED